MKTGLVFALGLTLVMWAGAGRLALSAEDESLGVKAGKAYLEAEKSAQDSYEKASTQGTQAAKEFEKQFQETMKILSEHAEKTIQRLKQTTDDMLKALNQEMEKFHKTVEAGKDKNAPQGTPSV